MLTVTVTQRPKHTYLLNICLLCVLPWAVNSINESCLGGVCVCVCGYTERGKVCQSGGEGGAAGISCRGSIIRVISEEGVCGGGIEISRVSTDYRIKTDNVTHTRLCSGSGLLSDHHSTLGLDSRANSVRLRTGDPAHPVCLKHTHWRWHTLTQKNTLSVSSGTMLFLMIHFKIIIYTILCKLLVFWR